MAGTTGTQTSPNRETRAFLKLSNIYGPWQAAEHLQLDGITAEEKAIDLQSRDWNQMPFSSQRTSPVFLACGFHARLLRSLFADSLGDLRRD